MSVTAKVAHIFQYSGLVKQFALRDLKLRYERSVLGFLWALLNPLLMIGVYTFVFSLVLRQGIDRFPIFLVAALLPWNFLARSIAGVSPLLYQSGYLLNRAAFPSESIIFGGMAAAFVDFCLEMGVFAVILVLMGMPVFPGLLIVPLVMVVYLLFVSGVVLLYSVGYVFYRDTQYISGILTTAWFFMTPVFYSAALVPENFRLLYNLNPMVHFAAAFRIPLYNGEIPPWSTLVITAVVAIDVFVLGWLLVDKYRHDFAEVL